MSKLEQLVSVTHDFKQNPRKVGKWLVILTTSR